MVSIDTTCKPDLSVNIGKLKLKNPILSASGTFGYTDEYEDYLNLQNIGAVVTKGMTLQPRKGNQQPRIKELNNGLINSIGLENIGINAFIENKLPILLEKNINFILNIAGFSIEEYTEIARICQTNNIRAIELNVSCPNVKSGCLEFGTSAEDLYRLISNVREVYEGTVVVKLSSNVANPVKLALAAQKANADAISAINTVKSLSVDVRIIESKIQHSVMQGGLSGPTIKPIALNFIHTISKEVNIPVIGIGGISNINDVIEFVAVGSTAIQVGTANFTNPCITGQLINELETFLQQNQITSFKNLVEGVKNDYYH